MKVSIVVPVYNNEAYIGRCIDSIVCQDHKNFEIIIVDDGSTDGSLKRCREFESERIRVYTKPNGGPASARNFGLQMCSEDSECVMFVDSDDTVACDYVSSMQRLCGPGSLAICGINDYYADYSVDESAAVRNGKYDEFSDFWMNPEFLKRLRLGIINSSCNKCYSLTTIRDNNIAFESSYPEDTRFNLAYLEHCDKVYILHDKLYNYIHRSQSVTSKPTESLYDEYMKIQSRLVAKVPKEHKLDILEFVYPQYLGNTLNYLRIGDNATPRRYLRMKSIREAVRAHKPTCMGDAAIKYLLIAGLFGMLKRL